MDYWFKLHTHDVVKIKNFTERRDDTERVSRVPVMFQQNVSFLQGERKKLMRNKTVQEDLTQESDDTPPPPSKEIVKKIKQEQKVKKDVKIKKEVKEEKKQESKFPTKDRPKPPRLSKMKQKELNPETDSSSFTSMSKDCVTELNTIIKQREKKNKKEKNITRFVDTEAEEKEETVEVEKEKMMDSPKKRRSILKSISTKQHVNSDESALLIKEDTAEEQNTGEKEAKAAVPIPEPRKVGISSSSETKSSVPKEPSSVDEQKSTEEKVNIDNEEEDSESEVDSEEDSDEETEESGEEEEESEEESDDDDDEVTTTEATTRADTSAADTSTVSEAVKPSKVIVTPDLHLDASNDSHDSEGVVTKKSPVKKTSCLSSKDNIIILISDFEAAKDASFINNDQVSTKC